MRVLDVNGTAFEITKDEEARIAHQFQKNGYVKHGDAAHYAKKTEAILEQAQNELRELTGDYPEDLAELHAFAAKHELFGDGEDTHVMCNFLRVFYCLMQKESHNISE